MFKKIKNIFSADINNGSNLTLYKTKNKVISILVGVLRYLTLISIAYVVMYPLFYMLSSSFRAYTDFFDPGVLWIPKQFTTEWYTWAVNCLDYFVGLKNTILFELVAAFLEIMSCSIIAYGLARFDFKGKKILMAFLILTILVPDQMIIIPKMMNFSHLDFLGILSLIEKITGAAIRPNVLDSGLVFYLPSIFGIGLRSGIIMFIYMQFYKGLPKELEEAAWIDGAGLFQTYTRIALPSSGVVITTVSILSIIWHWNDYYLAYMLMNDPKVLPLAVKLSVIDDNLRASYSVYGGFEATATKGAACILFILPMLVMYIFLQRKFVKSIDRVGITG